jgi:hypothetical protein
MPSSLPGFILGDFLNETIWSHWSRHWLPLNFMFQTDFVLEASAFVKFAVKMKKINRFCNELRGTGPAVQIYKSVPQFYD